MQDRLAPLRALAAAFAPARFPYLRFLVALGIGWCGGYAFAWLRLPLPWMLGPMSVLTVASLLRLPVAAPAVIRPPMTAVIGIMLGASFKPDMLDHIGTWFATMLGLALFVTASAFACILYLHKVAGFDRETAYFSGMPGGLVEMIELGEQRGADHNTIALAHSARILMIVFTLPFLVQWLEGVSLGNRSQLGAGLAAAPWSGLELMILCGFAGAWAGRRLGLPGPYLLGPMLASAAIHVAGITDFTPPREIVNTAQMVLGTVLGCRFAGTPPTAILRVLRIALGSTAILLAVTIAFAWGLGRLTGHGMVPIMLAYSPGGLAEMSLVALALHTDVAFVAAHHIVRIVLVMVSAGPILRLLDRLDPKPAPSSHASAPTPLDQAAE
ncbi:AbrB family transcriptional regulator [Prosthecodimorpha staleyi]|uniref:AbrB family transcriptional regulator n=1 Tax=Prosthecodimorpha staleyi TaxID=2840188 RepID=A0A947D2E5_9HYPH|nr:AbrB family transcriptional regulator [Prosthecodimorpha staleyi]MBT9289708.1 AbrB family transcriptional regulator [Prosthecodimorpha staleyi]